MMNNNSKKMILSLFVLMTGVLFLVGGVSYAWFSFQANGEKSSSITTNGITFSYKEGSRTIGLNEAMPMTDSEGMNQNNYFEFDITSSGIKDSLQIPYDIALNKSNNSSNIDDAIKVGLSEVINNENDVYGVVKNSLFNLDLEHLDNDEYEFEYNKKYEAGSVADEVIYVSNYYDPTAYSTIEECKNANFYKNNLFISPSCKKIDESYYALQQVYFLNQDECSVNCSVKYNIGDTIESDIYDVNVWYKQYSNLSYSECTELVSQENCQIKYPAGIMEKEIGIFKYNELNNYLNKLTNTQNEKLLFQDQVSTDNYKKTFRLRMWIDYNTDFTQSKYNNANFGLNVNVYGEGKEK